MGSLLLCMLFSGVCTSSLWPSGTFHGHVRPLFVPAQEITVTTTGRDGGRVRLRGAVNAEDVFRFRRVDGEWDVQLGPRIVTAMRRVHADLVEFRYDDVADRGIATVRLPLVGNVRVVLTRTEEGDSTGEEHVADRVVDHPFENW